MDILTDILKAADIKKTVLASHAFYKPWAVRFPCEKSMGFHIITQGEAFVRSKKLKNPVHMKKGDLILISRGFEHELATDLKIKVQSLESFPSSDEDGKKPLMTLASGVYMFHTDLLPSLFRDVPDYILIRSEEIAAHDPLQAALQLLSAELANKDLGSEAVTRNLMDILFHYILRKWIQTAEGKGPRWSLALRDPNLGKALRAMHEEPHNSWSVEELASKSGLSRAAFAQKFKSLTGETPAHYLAQIRIQKATWLFRSDPKTVEEVAQEVGYQDSFVFSKVFKRLLGMSPRDYKKSLTNHELRA